MIEKYLCKSSEINLQSTLDGGQCFRWHKFENGFNGVIDNECYYIFEKNNFIYVSSNNLNDHKLNFIKNYLDLKFDINLFSSNFKDNKYLLNLFNKYYGLRILKQDQWEVMVSFITSSVSNVSKIKKNINDLCLNLGKKIGDNMYDYTFPKPIEILEFGESNLRKLGFGFRSPYIIDASKMIIKDENFLRSIFDLSYEESLLKLTSIKGVGRKVADCIMTYGYHRKDVFAVDRWVRRGLVNKLGYYEGYSNDKLSEIARSNFGSYSSYLQQYIFYGEKS